MPLVYVGRVAYYHGRPLWEIVMNLKDFGVGRIVYRNIYKRYPEVSYLRIVSVSPTIIEYPVNMKGHILMERVHRGVKEPELWDAGKIAYKPDFSLVPKHEEEAFINSGAKPQQNLKIYPKYMKYPPLWQEFIKREKAMLGQQVTEEDLRLPLLYKSRNIRIAQDGEKPDFEYGDLVPQRPELYPHLQKKPLEDGSEAQTSSN